MSFGLAPSASPYARLVRLPPAFTDCHAFQLTPLKLPPTLIGSYALQQRRLIQLRLAPQTVSLGSASDSTSGFHRLRYLPATPSVRPPACADACILRSD
jgi:hypothetical protein